jgi:hypothetical protein
MSPEEAFHRAFRYQEFDIIVAVQQHGCRTCWCRTTHSGHCKRRASTLQAQSPGASAADQQETTFIFMSPWTWNSSDPKNKIENWIAVRKTASSWKDVRYIDGVLKRPSFTLSG